MTLSPSDKKNNIFNSNAKTFSFYLNEHRGLEFTYGAVFPDDAVRNITVGADACVVADQNVLFHLATVAEADSGPSVHIVAGIRAAPPLLVSEIGLWSDGVNPPPYQV